MSLEKLYNAVNEISYQAVNEGLCPEDKIQMGKTVLLLSQAYQLMKDLELHEKFHNTHPSGEFKIPGEDLLEHGGN